MVECGFDSLAMYMCDAILICLFGEIPSAFLLLPSFISFLSIVLSGEYSMYPGILLILGDFFFFFVVMIISVTTVCAGIMGEGACLWR